MNPEEREYPIPERGEKLPREEVLKQPTDVEAIAEMGTQITQADELASALSECKKTYPHLVHGDRILAELTTRLESEISNQESFIRQNEEQPEFLQAVVDACIKLLDAQLMLTKIRACQELDKGATVDWVIRNIHRWQPGLRRIIDEGIDREPQPTGGETLSVDQLRIKYQFARVKVTLLERAAQPIFETERKWFSGQELPASDEDLERARIDIKKAQAARAQIAAARKTVDELFATLRNQKE